MYHKPLVLPVACVSIWQAGLGPAEDFDFQSLSDFNLFHHVGSAGKHIEQMFWFEKAKDSKNVHTNTSKEHSAGIQLLELEGMETSTGQSQQHLHHI